MVIIYVSITVSVHKAQLPNQQLAAKWNGHFARKIGTDIHLIKPQGFMTIFISEKGFQ